MNKCSTLILYLSPLLSAWAAANLRRNPVATVAIGTAEDLRHSQSKRLWSKDESYVLTLENHKGVQYFAPITLNKQKLAAVYDTGSFEIMAMSNMCSACQIPSNLFKYDNTTSETFTKGDNAIIDHYFAGGLVVAKQDFETVHIGDFGKDFAVKDMPFWQVVHTNMGVWMNKKAQFTAIVGLGHRTSVPGTPEGERKVDSLLERTGTDRFAICLQKGRSNPGFITFNPHLDLPPPALVNAASESSTPSSMFRRIPVIGKSHWAVELNEVSHLNGKDTDRRCHDGTACVAIIDSGTSLIGVPPMAVPMVMSIIKEIKQDCSNLDDMQDLVFTLGGQRFAMPPAAYVVQFPDGAGGHKCLPAFTDFDMESRNGQVWILGMPFLRQFYTVFDRTEPSIYVADQGDNCDPVSSNSTMNATFVNTSFVAPRLHQEPALADISEAMLPSWAQGRSIMDI